MRRPKGIKTKKSVAKRFKITAGGKVLRSSAGRRHLAQSKNPKRRRSLRGLTARRSNRYLPHHSKFAFQPLTLTLTLNFNP